MKSVVYLIGGLVALGACSSADPAVGSCAPVFENYLSLPNPQESFPTYPVETQYRMLICGSQAMHPPILLADKFAMEGEAVVSFLAVKLEQTDYEATIRDIVDVFAAMTTYATYDVKSDQELMQLIRTKVALLQGAFREHADAQLTLIEGSTDVKG